MIKANNMAVGRKIAIIAVYLKNAIANWYKANKININQYANRVEESFI